PAPMSPSARRLAANENVDATQLTGTGRGGRITKEDVQAYLDQRKTPPPAPTPAPPPGEGPRQQEPAPPPPASRPQPAADQAETRQRMTAIRQRIAERLVASQHSAAILTTFNEADMSAVMALRTRYKETFQKKHGIGLGFMAFFVKAAVEALRAFPLVNSRI